MRLQTTGNVQRLDLAGVLDLIPALVNEWADLRFDESGAVVHPDTREPQPQLTLREGRHRTPGTRYDLRFPTVRPTPDVASVTLRRDDEVQLSLTLTESRDRWTIDADLRHGRPPNLDLTARADLTGLMRDGEIPGIVAWLFRGIGDVAVHVTPAPLLDGSGEVLNAAGHAGRLRFGATIEVASTSTHWDVKAAFTLSARGLARPILLIARPIIKRKIAQADARFWAQASAAVTELRKELDEIEEAVANEGGPQPFVRRALWNPDDPPGTDAAVNPYSRGR
ncbi:hypothetical protein [Phytoactinopolyspora limicola]|uniref:hypothetical protein n=1 Tax=Phytoactinopolyspora limicola TaxID=2715536 RepID=UPI00140951F4|nr:hypothetical protein [Phytoactinopolyspora limicola]